MDALQDHEVLDGQWDDGVPDGPSSGHDRYDACDDDAAQAEWEDELPRLMARLGQLIALHGPAGVVAMARSEAERRELTAYAAGWQDAAAEFTPRVAAARRDGWLGRWRPLRVLNGPGDVIPFPVARQYAHPAPHPAAGDAVVNGWDDGLDAAHDTGPAAHDSGPDAEGDRGYAPGRDPAQDRGFVPGHEVPQGRGYAPARDPQPDPEAGQERVNGTGRHDVPPRAGAPRRPGARTHDDSAHGGRDEDEPAHGDEPSATRSHGEVPGQEERTGQRTPPPPRPSLPAKSRWSRAPTIPRLAPQQRPPGRGPDGTPSPDAPA